MINKILNCGLDRANGTHVKQRVKLSNLMVVAFTPLTVFYIVFSYFKYPEISWIYYLILFFSCCSVWLNGIGWDKTAALIISLLPTSTTFLTVITTTPPGEEVNPYFKLSMTAFWVLPWLFFSIQDRWYLIGPVLSNILFLFLGKAFSYYFFIEGADFTIVHSAFFDTILLFTAISTILLGMFMFQVNMNKLNKEKEEVHNKMKSRESDLRNSEHELKEYIQKQEEHKKEEEKQQWVSKGISEVNDIIRENNDELSNLSRLLVKNVVKYLGANQGGLFISNGKEGGNEALELASCYAYGRDKYLKREIYPGEGLVGQCFLEKESICLTEIPQGYMDITSGLGKSLPRNIVIVPLIYDDKVVGVIELATFEEMEDYKLKFVEKVAEGIGSVIANARVNEKTKQLLASTQEQAEELRTREEEMRQNMEELQATQEAMQRKQQELEEMKTNFENETTALKTERDELLKKLELQNK